VAALQAVAGGLAQQAGLVADMADELMLAADE